MKQATFFLGRRSSFSPSVVSGRVSMFLSRLETPSHFRLSLFFIRLLISCSLLRFSGFLSPRFERFSGFIVSVLLGLPLLTSTSWSLCPFELASAGPVSVDCTESVCRILPSAFSNDLSAPSFSWDCLQSFSGGEKIYKICSQNRNTVARIQYRQHIEAQRRGRWPIRGSQEPQRLHRILLYPIYFLA
jgi:hypothetical protein